MKWLPPARRFRAVVSADSQRLVLLDVNPPAFSGIETLGGVPHPDERNTTIRPQSEVLARGRHQRPLHSVLQGERNMAAEINRWKIPVEASLPLPESNAAD